MFNLMFSFALSLAAADPAASSAGGTATAEDAPKAEKLICRRVQALGTRLAKRECLSRKQWEAIDDAKRTGSDGRDPT